MPLRCELARELGIDEVIDASAGDPVAQVLELTDGRGADIVVEAVGGRAGAQAFAEAQDMLKSGGLLQVLGLYENEPLPLYSEKIMGKRLIGSYLDASRRPEGSARTLELLATDQIQFAKMIHSPLPLHRGGSGLRLALQSVGRDDGGIVGVG